MAYVSRGLFDGIINVTEYTHVAMNGSVVGEW